MPRDILARLLDPVPLEYVPLESTDKVRWADPRNGLEFTGYMVDVDALTVEELQAIYKDMKERFPDIPVFDSWVEIVKNEGMPIRDERVLLVMTDVKMVV